VTSTRAWKTEPRRKLNGGSAQPPTPQDQIKALGHVLRRKILRILHEVEEARSPGELSRDLGLGLPKVSYHVNVLNRCGAVALTDTQPARGALEHFYASTVSEEEIFRVFLEATAPEDQWH
jgi:DNA-binding transcriptional ArsR family regulator